MSSAGHGGSPSAARLAVFRQVCAAVQYAHQHLVIHRDIKAANILVTADGTPKLLDFGIAKLLDPDTGLEFSTHTTVRVMTPESASPEQLAGKPLTVAADVYALGVLLYRLLTDQSPYRGALERDTELVRAVCEQVPAAPSELPAVTGARVPRDVDTIVMKALRKEPERRYGSAEQLSADIQRFLEGRPVQASPDSFRYRAGKFLSRHRVAVPAVAAVVVAIVLRRRRHVVAGARRAARARPGPTRSARAPSASSTRSAGLARSVLGELHDAVQRLPGSTPAREILLRRGTEYLDALSAEARRRSRPPPRDRRGIHQAGDGAGRRRPAEPGRPAGDPHEPDQGDCAARIAGRAGTRRPARSPASSRESYAQRGQRRTDTNRCMSRCCGRAGPCSMR